ncbi:MAG: M24 family metallopeptidase [Clostridiaceae bacterium]|nr:M24 family metallopeptidase [Clostridiaceae bacterium]
MPELNLSGPRYKYPVSTAELNRRLAAVQAELKKADLDCCIVQTQSTIFDSVVRYMTDQLGHPYGTTILIPTKGKMTMINHGVDNPNAPAGPALRNVEKLIVRPYCQTFGCTDGLTAESLAAELNTHNFRRIGVVFKQLVSADTLDLVRKGVPGCELVDFSKQFSYIKAVKSAEEWDLVDRCILAHKQLMDMVPALIRPGRMEYEVLADIEHASRYIACDRIGNIAVGSAPNGAGSGFFQNFKANRRFEMGDSVTVMIEVSGPGGIYGELARSFCLGRPDPEFVKLFEDAREVQHLVADACKPGVTGRELNEVYDKFVVDRGIAPNGRFVGHGQGYDMMEAPVISPFEDMEMREDMLLAIHPELVRNGHFAICCDNFRVTKDGARLLSLTDQEITVLKF